MWSYLYVRDLTECAKVCNELRLSLSIMGSYTDPTSLSSIQIFSLLDSQTGGVHYYFSPEAQPVAYIVGAEPCGIPPFNIQEQKVFLSGHFFDELQLI